MQSPNKFVKKSFEIDEYENKSYIKCYMCYHKFEKSDIQTINYPQLTYYYFDCEDSNKYIKKYKCVNCIHATDLRLNMFDSSKFPLSKCDHCKFNYNITFVYSDKDKYRESERDLYCLNCKHIYNSDAKRKQRIDIVSPILHKYFVEKYKINRMHAGIFTDKIMTYF